MLKTEKGTKIVKPGGASNDHVTSCFFTCSSIVIIITVRVFDNLISDVID
jgi:hypothetical protein